MPFMVAALPLISAGIGAAGSIMSGIAQKNQADYRAQIAERNAVVAGMQGEQEIQAGQQKSAMTSLAGAEKLGRVKTEMAANNVDINRGSAVDVRASERAANVLDTETQLWNAQNKLWGYAQQAVGDVAQAKLEKSAGSQAMFSGILGGASDILGGLGKTFAPGAGGLFGSASPTSSSVGTFSPDVSGAAASSGPYDASTGAYSP
jgi:hypothetical protein